MKTFAQHAQELHETPAEVVGAVVAAASTSAIEDALQAAFESPEAFEAAWQEDSCYALDLLEIELEVM